MRNRIQIRIQVKGWIRIHIKAKSWIQIRITMTRSRENLSIWVKENPDPDPKKHRDQFPAFDAGPKTLKTKNPDQQFQLTFLPYLWATGRSGQDPGGG